MYTRRQRRALAKSVGLFGETSVAKWHERVARSQDAGKQIDQQFKNQVETNLRNAAAERDARTASNLEASLGKEEADHIMANNARLKSERDAKLQARRERQSKK